MSKQPGCTMSKQSGHAMNTQSGCTMSKQSGNAMNKQSGCAMSKQAGRRVSPRLACNQLPPGSYTSSWLFNDSIFVNSHQFLLTGFVRYS
jgi:hypothetical protein